MSWGYMFSTYVPTNQDAMLQILRQNKVEIAVAPDEEKIDWSTWLLNFSPLIPLAGATLWFFMVPSPQPGSVLRVVLWWLAVWGAIFIGCIALWAGQRFGFFHWLWERGY
jgi:hypothetical protein